MIKDRYELEKQPYQGEYVVVRYDDLRILLNEGFDKTNKYIHVWDAYDRLKAALEEQP